MEGISAEPAAGVAFAVPQFLISNLHGPWLVDIIAGACSISATVILLRFWRPKTMWSLNNGPETEKAAGPATNANAVGTNLNSSRREIVQAWLPWAILTAFLLFWGLPQFKSALDRLAPFKLAVPHLHNVVQRVEPVALPDAKPEKAEFR
jgi:lactate permease